MRTMRKSRSALGRVGTWFILSGVLVAGRAVVELTEPVYWNPVSIIDYAAAILTTVAWVVTGVAFILWWQSKPARRVAVLLLVSGAGTAVSGVGNLLEDVFDIEFGEFLFTFGGMVGAIAILGAAILWLTVSDVMRWSGLFLVFFVAGSVFPDNGGQFLSALSLLALGLWLWLVRSRSQRESAAG